MRQLLSTFDEVQVTDSQTFLTLLALLFIILVAILAFKRFRPPVFHETGFALLIGLFAGLIYRAAKDAVSAAVILSPQLYFYLLLIPVFFNAGYDLRKKYVFTNFGTILLYSVFGTTLATFLTGYIMWGYVKGGYEDVAVAAMSALDCVKFGALISATDPVTITGVFHDLHADVNLYGIIFGDSILNNAVAIVLFKTIVNIGTEHGAIDGPTFFLGVAIFVAIFLGSACLGIVISMFTSLMTKYLPFQEYPALESGLFIVLSYTSYLIAESVHLSGIVAVIFCGMTQSHYTYYNLSVPSQQLTRQMFNVFNLLAENFIFLYIGIILFAASDHIFLPGFIVLSIVAIIVSRAVIITLCTLLANLCRKPALRMDWQQTFMVIWASMRGSIAFALAIGNTATDADRIILATVICIIMFTVIVLGGFSALIIKALHIETDVKEVDTDEFEFDRAVTVERAREKYDLQMKNQNAFVRFWIALDNKFLKPFFRVGHGTVGTCAPCRRSTDRPRAANAQFTNATVPITSNQAGDQTTQMGHDRSDVGLTSQEVARADDYDEFSD